MKSNNERAAAGAKEIRTVLKKSFPSTKFSVTSRSYTGGSSIYITWTDGAKKQEVEQAVKRFERCEFDGMEDLKVCVNPNGFADYICCQKRFSDAFIAGIIAELKTKCNRKESVETLVAQWNRGEMDMTFKIEVNRILDLN